MLIDTLLITLGAMLGTAAGLFLAICWSLAFDAPPLVDMGILLINVIGCGGLGAGAVANLLLQRKHTP